MTIRHVLWFTITICLVFVSLVCLFRLDPLRDRLPPAAENLLSRVESVLLPDPVDEHLQNEDSATSQEAADAEEQTTEEEIPVVEADKEEAGKEEIAPDEENGPAVFEENPRYTMEIRPDGSQILRSEILKGDTAGKILGDWLDSNQLADLLAAAKKVYPLTHVKLGQPFAIIRDTTTKDFKAFKYELNKERFLFVEKTEAGFKAQMQDIDFTISLIHIKGSISDTLSDAVNEQGEGVALAIALANIFGSDINFITDLRKGDTFEVLAEKRFRQGQPDGYGRVLGARFTNQKKLHTAYLFHNDKGRETYYAASGDNLRRELLKAPLSFLRVTSKYSMARRHPVSGKVRPHQGIDYGAPKGTPIMAVGSGVITDIGRAGGYGKQIIIRHENGIESLYGHMSRFAKGMKSGKQIRQGQTIGYVGSTGVATGPHLDFRIRKNGTFVNPSKLIVPRDQAIESRRLALFRQCVDRVDAYWQGRRALAEYDPDTWFGDED